MTRLSPHEAPNRDQEFHRPTNNTIESNGWLNFTKRNVFWSKEFLPPAIKDLQKIHEDFNDNSTELSSWCPMKICGMRNYFLWFPKCCSWCPGWNALPHCTKKEATCKTKQCKICKRYSSELLEEYWQECRQHNDCASEAETRTYYK